MNISWKKTLLWLAAALILLFIPMTYLLGIYAAMTAICYLSASITTAIKKNVKPYIPYSIAAVIQAVLISLIAGSEIDSAESRSFLAAGAFMTVLFFVPFLLIMAAVVYIRGRKKENEEQHYE